MMQTDSRTSVDQRKLEKADARLKQKQEKRAQKEQVAGAGIGIKEYVTVYKFMFRPN